MAEKPAVLVVEEVVADDLCPLFLVFLLDFFFWEEEVLEGLEEDDVVVEAELLSPSRLILTARSDLVDDTF